MAVVDQAAPRPRYGSGVVERWAQYPHKRVVVAVVFIVVLVVVSHGLNMLHYPYLEDDEGYYFSQGWATFHQGRLAPSPYIYFYEHAPLGWIQMGLWQVLTGGASFGYSIASGRVLMLLFQLASTLLVFAIGRKVSGRTWVGVVAATIFALSPFGIYFHRRVLLDNVTTFWILLSLWALVGRVTLRRVCLSAVALGIAVLSKEIAIALVPAMAVLAARQTPKESRLFAIVGWAGVAGAVISTYVLLALLKGEFFPAGTMLGGAHKHVSLLCSLQWQSARGPHDGGIINPSSLFWSQATSWAQNDPLLLIGGSFAACISTVLLRRDAVISMIGWMILSLWVFLGRGGILIDFYLIPMLPLAALCIALVAHRGVTALTSRTIGPKSRVLTGVLVTGVTLGLVAALIPAYQESGLSLWQGRPVVAQTDATKWIQHHVSSNSRMVIDMYQWLDLHQPSGSAPAFRNAEYYWKAAADPRIATSIFANNWRRVQYVVTTPQLLQDTRNSGFPMIIKALDHSTSLASFNSGGWPVDVRKVDPRLPNNHMLPLGRRRYDTTPCMRYGA